MKIYVETCFVEFCKYCPNCLDSDINFGGYRCHLTQKELENINIIDKDCPLKDVE